MLTKKKKIIKEENKGEKKISRKKIFISGLLTQTEFIIYLSYISKLLFLYKTYNFIK